MSVQFAISFEDRGAANAATAALRAKGYEVDVQLQPSGGAVVVVSMSRRTVSDVSGTYSLRRIVANEYGGDFMGHGGIASYGLDE